MLSRIRKFLSREKLALRFFYHWWRLKRVAACAAVHVSARDRVLIVPCDPWSVVGSRGDQAMILATCQAAHEKYPGLPIDVLADSHATDDALRELDLNPVVHWPPLLGNWFQTNVGKYKAVYILGADVTDGVYGWVTSLNLIAAYDLFARAGADTHYLGFSFSTRPDSMMKHVFRFLKKDLPLPTRDPVSYVRVKNFTVHRPVDLIADAAFCLKPISTERIQNDRAWCDEQHALGRKVLAVNVHPMFNDLGGTLEEWKTCFVQILTTVLDRDETVSLFLLPHDDRPTISDSALLQEIARRFQAHYSPRLHCVDTVYRADEIKALVGGCDALLAGRMHLSIAALGQGIPVLALVYQGKFEGLWQHFGLTSETLCSPQSVVMEPARVQNQLYTFLNTIPTLRAQIKSRLPQVLALSQSQF